ncbi:MAG: hypothetical protein GY858_02185 [Candidatus Omnitrophica bacterium]|nr:hypothetical protein [Candidatus Omnitrophota bacterium]
MRTKNKNGWKIMFKAGPSCYNVAMSGNRKLIRLRNHDYSRNGIYGVTICVKNKENYFGKIICRDAIYRVLLNDNGKIVNKYWDNIVVQFPFVELDEYVIMPNHVHGIIAIRDSCGVSLSKIIRWYKGRVTYEIRKSGNIFLWQGRFYDQIVRNDQSLYAVRKYIRNNPKNWQLDTENKNEIMYNMNDNVKDAINRVPTRRWHPSTKPLTIHKRQI